MVRTARRARLLKHAFACATSALALAGCGGGGSSPGGGGGGVTPPTESPYLLAEFVAAGPFKQSVHVWDPARPAVAVQDVALVQSNGIVWTGSHLVFSDATTYDAASHTRTTLAHAKVFYDNDGKLYSIDLRGGHSHAPVQLSSAVDVFQPTSATPMNAAGDDAWVDAQGGAHHWAIRSTMGATDAPASIEQILAPLRDLATGFPQYFFASLGAHSGNHVTPTTYEVVDTSFTPVSVPAVAAMVATDGWIGVDPGQAGLGYLRIDNQLRKLAWSAAGVSVDAANLLAFTGFSQSGPTADAQSLFFVDGAALYSVAGGSVHAIGSFSTAPTSLVDAGAYVAGVEPNGISATQVRNQLETLRKSDGKLTLLEDAATTLQLLAASDQGLVITGTVEQGPAFVLASGDNGTRTTLGAQAVGVVRSASARLDQPGAPVALLSCVAGTTGYCVAGALTQLSLAGAATTIGTLAASAPWVRGDALVGVATSLGGQSLLATPGGFGDGETDRRDAWQFTPGVAGSLARATSNLP